VKRFGSLPLVQSLVIDVVGYTESHERRIVTRHLRYSVTDRSSKHFHAVRTCDFTLHKSRIAGSSLSPATAVPRRTKSARISCT